MRILDAVWWSLSSLRSQRVRATLAILGVAIGAMLLVAVMSQTEGINTSIRGQLESLGANMLVISPESEALTLDDADVNMIRNMAYVEDVIPVISVRARVYGVGGYQDCILTGVEPEKLDKLLKSVEVAEGRALSTSIGEAVVGYDIAHPEGRMIPFTGVGYEVMVEYRVEDKAYRQKLVVVGVFEKTGGSLLAGTALAADKGIYVSLDTAKVMSNKQSYDSIAIEVDSPEHVDAVVSNLRAYYGGSISIINVKSVLEVTNNILSSLSAFTIAISMVSTVVAALGIANVMIMSVMERTREIGVLKALGYTNRTVMGLFLLESVMMGVIGAMVGIALGVGLAYGNVFQSAIAGSRLNLSFSPIVTSNHVLIALAFAVTVSMLAGVYPARRAAKLEPVAALRYE